MSTPSRPPEDTLAAGLISKPVKTRPTSARTQRYPSLIVKRTLKTLGIGVILVGAGALVSLSLWASAVLILRPNPPQWLARHLPHWSKGWGEIPIQTIADIEAELEQQQRYRGDFVDLALLNKDGQFAGTKLLPIFETRSPCNRNCEAITEVRLYGVQRREGPTDYLQLLHRLPVKGPTEEDIFDPLSHGDVGTVGSTYRLPLDALKPLHESELPGVWLTLTGRWQTQGSRVLYGQMLHVNAQTLEVSSLLNWKSPPGRLPSWYEVDGAGLPELLVNQSYGLEPDYRLYRIGNLTATQSSTRLQEISLNAIQLPQGISTKPYRDALYLAQQGLWSDAEKQLAPIKQRLDNQWSQELEQQLQLISLHARFSKTQAERDWSQPSQKLLALLLDGQWDTALKSLTVAQGNLERAVLPLLERDSNRIWQRLTATLKVRPGQKSAQLWGALLLLAKEDEAAALKWLTQGQKDSPLKQEFEAIAQKLLPPDPQTVAAANQPQQATGQSANQTQTTSSSSTMLTGFFGTVEPLNGLEPDAWQPWPSETELTISPQQQGYAVTLQSGHSSQQWQRASRLSWPSPLHEVPPDVLGLSANATLDLVDTASGQYVQTLQIKAIRRQGSAVVLFAIGFPVETSAPLVAVTPGQWYSPATVSSQSLLQLFQAQPEMGDRILPVLKNHLGFEPTTLATTLQQQSTGADALATVRQIDLTNRSESEMLLTLAPQLGTSLGLSNQAAISLVITPEGELLYSTLWAGSPVLSGWIQAANGLPALVIVEGDRPRLLTWSSQNQRFED
ncbi:hypothetical protein PN498_05015 [Oscillatoria sp. CS-180]|uniref:hypothetical protein n=1 Tax=Oscillatoria sp. CS-180 TaxID=3021720 RepID=UPI00232D58D0|nr:hypothetical protein [Oscillatoria sp. CS-180]MDB9525338.1 hypothetical protein [Oscillatoria sp. CS-180]